MISIFEFFQKNLTASKRDAYEALMASIKATWVNYIFGSDNNLAVIEPFFAVHQEEICPLPVIFLLPTEDAAVMILSTFLTTPFFI